MNYEYYELDKGHFESWLMRCDIHGDVPIAYTDSENVVRCLGYEENIDFKAFKDYCDSYLENEIEIEK